MLKINKDNWKFIVFFCVAVLTYLFLDIVDVAGMLRQILIFPVCFIVPFHSLDVLDVDTAARSGIVYRVCAFAIALGAALLPTYLYIQTKKKMYLVLSGIVTAWIIVSFCFFFFVFLSMSGMMD